MKNAGILIFVFLSLVYSSERGHPPLEFFAGNFHLLGKESGSSETYFGKAKIEVEKDKFKMTRTIDGKTMIIYGVYDKSLPEGLSALKFEYILGKKSYILVYEWYSDYNNYPVLSGFIRQSDDKWPDDPGLEFLKSSD